MDTNDLRPQHRRALVVAGSVMAQVGPGDLARPSPCAGWDLGALLGHVVGQNHGFADAVASPDAPLAAFADRPPDPDAVLAAWQASAERVDLAFTAAALDRRVPLVEISDTIRFPVASIVGFHLLDTVVHTWDVAAALGVAFRPDDELVGATLAIARLIPDGPTRQRPTAQFAPALDVVGADPWPEALALLGRRERWSAGVAR